MRLLVAENDPALATFLHNSFDAEHYAVDLTRNSEEAKQMVQGRSYDLAIRRDEPAHAGNQALKFHFKRRSIKLLITWYALAPNRLAASGYGEYYPAASNETEEGRAMNRGVDLVILNSNAEAAPRRPQQWFLVRLNPTLHRSD
jgi:hypothetical protein